MFANNTQSRFHWHTSKLAQKLKHTFLPYFPQAPYPSFHPQRVVPYLTSDFIILPFFSWFVLSNTTKFFLQLASVVMLLDRTMSGIRASLSELLGIGREVQVFSQVPTGPQKHSSSKHSLFFFPRLATVSLHFSIFQWSGPSPQAPMVPKN